MPEYLQAATCIDEARGCVATALSKMHTPNLVYRAGQKLFHSVTRARPTAGYLNNFYRKRRFSGAMSNKPTAASATGPGTGTIFKNVSLPPPANPCT